MIFWIAADSSNSCDTPLFLMNKFDVVNVVQCSLLRFLNPLSVAIIIINILSLLPLFFFFQPPVNKESKNLSNFSLPDTI